MAGLVPAIHEAGPQLQQYVRLLFCCTSSWMRGSSPRMTLPVGRTQFVFTFQTAQPTLRRPVSLRRRVRRRLGEDPLRPEKEPRARGTPGAQLDPRASTPRDIEACRSPCARLSLWFERRRSMPQVRQTQGVPRAVFNRLAPHPPRWSAPPREGETCCVTLHRLWAQALGGAPVTGAMSTYRPSRAPGMRIGPPEEARLGPPGPGAASPTPRVMTPATAPRPASGDADQTPLGNGGGMHCE